MRNTRCGGGQGNGALGGAPDRGGTMALCARTKWLILAAALAGAVVAPPARADWELWSGTSVSGSVGDDTSFKCNSSFRRDDGSERLYYALLEFGFERKVARSVTLGAYYAHVNSKQGSAWQVEYRPHVNATLRADMGPFGISDRNRVEFRTVGGETNVRYRNKLSVSLVGLKKAVVRPYVAAEPFYDFDAEELNRSRAYAGAVIMLRGGLGADVYYMYESRKKDDSWKGVPVVGTTLTFTF